MAKKFLDTDPIGTWPLSQYRRVIFLSKNLEKLMVAQLFMK
jgi:hypothetical protein